jgi:uncharacterized membrane protein YjgN (DUF898 family)
MTTHPLFNHSAHLSMNESDRAPVTSSAASVGEQERSVGRRFEFTGSGSEYFKIWIVNVLLTIVTLGIYSAWAKVRRLRYFYNNTQFAGSSFDFHGSPIAILKGRVIAVVLLALVQVPFVGPIFLLVYFCGLPWLIYRSFRFHLANTSYRNVRFSFAGTSKGAYAAVLVPLGIVVAAGVVAGLTTLISKVLGAVLVSVALLAFYGIVPYLQLRIRRYLSEGARAGLSRFGFNVTGGQYYVVYGVALGLVIAVVMVAAVVLAASVGLSALSIAKAGTGDWSGGNVLMIALVIGVAYLAIIAVAPLIISMLHNTVWRGTSLSDQRFDSRLLVSSYVMTWLGVTLLTVITFGLYRPFAVVKLAQMRIEAVSWMGSADDLIAVLREGNQRAMGSEVADLMDVDIGI